MNFFFQYFILFLFVIRGLAFGTIHVIGDSNAPYCFTNQLDLHPSVNIPRPDTPQWITYEECFLNDEIPCAIHWVQGRTMHRIGRDGLEGFNVKSFHVVEKDVVIFHFGAIDQGGHIYRQVIKGRELEEIIDTLVSNYLNTIKENRKMYDELTVIIQAILPPQIDPDPIFVDEFLESFPYIDFLSFQAHVTERLNRKLEAGCKEHHFIFLNVNDEFETPSGGLRKDRSDGRHHIDPKFNFIVKQKLIDLLTLEDEADTVVKMDRFDVSCPVI